MIADVWTSRSLGTPHNFNFKAIANISKDTLSIKNIHPFVVNKSGFIVMSNTRNLSRVVFLSILTEKR